MKDGALFIQKLSSSSVTAKHEFKSVFINNSSHHNIRIPINYTLFVIEGLTNYPTNSGNISQLKNLNSIVDLPSSFKLFTPQENQLYCDKEGTFLITCQSFLLSSYHAENISPDIIKSRTKLLKSFLYLDINCQETRRNTKFNYLDVTLNPTNIEESEPTTNCPSRTCRVFQQNQVDTNGMIAPMEHCCDHSEISLQHVPEAAHAIQDLRDMVGTAGPGPPSKQQTAASGRYFPAPLTDMWPSPDHPTIIQSPT
jgi:hypothetical protein